MEKVFVIQQPTQVRDYSSASRYGVVDYLLTSAHRPSLTPGPVLKKLREKMKTDFDPERDFLLWAGGDPISLFLTGTVCQQLGFDKVNFLVWERERDPETGLRKDVGFYTPSPIYFRFSQLNNKDHGAGYDD